MRVVIATEGSEASEEVFAQLRQILPSPAVLSEIFVVTVAEPGPMAGLDLLGGLPGAGAGGSGRADLALDKARKALGPLADKAYFRKLSGPPGAEIVRFAREIGCQLLVVGSRNLHGIDRMVMGSVSSHVVANAPCSVLVIK